MDDTRTVPFKKGRALGLAVAGLAAIETVLRVVRALPALEQSGGMRAVRNVAEYGSHFAVAARGVASPSSLEPSRRSAGRDPFQFQYDNAVTNFSLPEWMEEFFRSQPIATHNETLRDPNEKFIVMTCHKVRRASCRHAELIHIQLPLLLFLLITRRGTSSTERTRRTAEASPIA